MRQSNCANCGRTIVYATRNGNRRWYHLNDGDYEVECPDGGEATNGRRTRTRLPRLTGEELRALAQRYVHGEVYMPFDVRAADDSFGMLIALMKDRSVLDQAGAVYAIIGEDTTARMAINGHPVYFSCRFLHKDDVKPLLETVERMEKALETA